MSHLNKLGSLIALALLVALPVTADTRIAVLDFELGNGRRS